jgi:MinD superfamily P-loop ATPase
MAVPIIRELKRWHTFSDEQTVIRDAPPGTSCPVVETMRGSDFVLLVTEPTPFGLHDLKLAVQLTRELELPTGVVVNRAGLCDSSVDEYCQDAGIPILMRIPLDEAIGAAVARGNTLVEAFPEYLPRFRELHTQITSLIHPGKVADSIQALDARASREMRLRTS